MTKIEEKHHYMAVAIRTGGYQEIIGTYQTDQEAADAYVEWDRSHDHDSEKGEVWCVELRPGFEVKKPTSN